MPFSPPSPLLALVDATAEWHAGMASNCRASVRLLDRLEITVYPGDCVVVHHDDPAGARVLLAALSGHAALVSGRRFRGTRYCAPGVRVRRCSISAEAALAVQRGWRRGRATAAAAPASIAPAAAGAAAGADAVVHLLRVSRHQPLTAHAGRQWQAWADREGRAGGALVLVMRPDPETAAASTRLGIGPLVGHQLPGVGHVSDALREGAAPAYAGTAPSWSSAEGPAATTRELVLRHGRLSRRLIGE